MRGALSHLDTSPRSVARRGVLALILAAAAEFGVVLTAEAGNWPAGAFYTVSVLVLAILVVIAVPIVEPPRMQAPHRPTRAESEAGVSAREEVEAFPAKALDPADAAARHEVTVLTGSESLDPPTAAAGSSEASVGTAGSRINDLATLVAIAYPDIATAELARQQLIQDTAAHLVAVEDAVIVEHGPDGKIKLSQAMSTTGAGAAGGAIWGGLIGLLFLAPLLGMAVGAAAAALGGKITDVGVNDNFIKELGAKLQPGGAALIALGSTDARDQLIERLRPFGGEIIQASLDEEKLRAATGERSPAS